MTASQLTRLVVVRELAIAVAASLAASTDACTQAMVLARAGNNAAQSIAVLEADLADAFAPA